MRNRIERLRLWLGLSAGLLLAILVGFIGTARYLKRHALARLGSHLGVDIRSETNGFTYSQSLQGRTIYTLHAAKEIEHANGVIGLHDVSMIIYGRTGDRADMVYGNEFEYDKNAGEIRAIGLVHIDLGGAGSGQAGSSAAKMLAQDHDAAMQDPKVLHATTSGLVYLDKLGVAATKEAIEFKTGQLTGHAVGADYSTDSGILLLHSGVNLSGMANGNPVNVTADAAQIDNRGQRAVLAHAHYSAPGESMEANQVILHSRPDSSLERIQADGAVRIGQRGAQLNAAHADFSLTPKNKVENSLFSGGVQYTRDEALRQARGQADKLQVAFDPSGAPLHASMEGAVHLIERSRAADDARQPWSVRDLAADHVETALVPSTPGKSEIKDAEARGNARLTMVDNGTTGGTRGRGTTELGGDILTAHLLPASSPGAQPLLDVLTAQGHTSVRQLSAEGVEQTSSGDALTAHFRAVTSSVSASASTFPATRKPATSSGGEQLASAVQTGHVRMTRKAPPKRPAESGAAATQDEPQDATAEQAVYDGDADRLTLSGGVRLQGTDSLILTDQLAFERPSGDAHAQGSVRVSYTQPTSVPSGGSRDPVHVLADRADFKHTAGLATFFGRPARMWQAGSQVQAPVLELSREQKTLAAHGDPQARYASGPVQTILVNAQAAGAKPGRNAAQRPAQTAAPNQNQAGTGSPAAAPAKTPQVIRVLSHDLLYSDADGKAQFNGSVQIESGGETVHARSATAFLEPAHTSSATKPPPPAASASPVSLDGRIDRVVATGDVVLDQPGRRATGNQLIYTAQDGSVLLTGAPAAVPRVVDTDHGTTVSAYAFRFHLGDESIEALSSLPGDSNHDRVRTEAPARR